MSSIPNGSLAFSSIQNILRQIKPNQKLSSSHVDLIAHSVQALGDQPISNQECIQIIIRVYKFATDKLPVNYLFDDQRVLNTEEKSNGLNTNKISRSTSLPQKTKRVSRRSSLVIFKFKSGPTRNLAEPRDTASLPNSPKEQRKFTFF